MSPFWTRRGFRVVGSAVLAGILAAHVVLYLSACVDSDIVFQGNSALTEEKGDASPEGGTQQGGSGSDDAGQPDASQPSLDAASTDASAPADSTVDQGTADQNILEFCRLLNDIYSQEECSVSAGDPLWFPESDLAPIVVTPEECPKVPATPDPAARLLPFVPSVYYKDADGGKQLVACPSTCEGVKLYVLLIQISLNCFQRLFQSAYAP